MKHRPTTADRSVVRLRSAAAAVALLGLANSAHAGITLYEKDAWMVSTDGRGQGFYSFANGDSVPKRGEEGVTLVGEGPFGAVGDDQGIFTTSRVRGGWTGSVLGFTVMNQISETLRAVGRLSFWFAIENDQAKGAANNVGGLDIRQGFVKLESTRWGGLLFGRNLGLHSRSAIIQNSIFSDEYGIGSPCGITGLGISCGQAGYGVLFPGFNPGVVYNTPDLRGFMLTVGAYDPTRIGPAMPGPTSYGQTPLPRFEFEANYHYDGGGYTLDLFLNGMWQRAVKTGGTATIDPVGVGYGGRVAIGRLKLGLLGGADRGGGMYVPIGDVSIDTEGTLRTVTTYWGQVMYSFEKVDATAGVGMARNHQTSIDAADTQTSLIKSHVGINAGLLYRLGPVVMVLQYFRMDHAWYRGETQGANVVSTGATFNW